MNGSDEVIAETCDAVEDLVHVYPLFGREHVFDGFHCWCEPERDVENPHVVVHKPEQ